MNKIKFFMPGPHHRYICQDCTLNIVCVQFARNMVADFTFTFKAARYVMLGE